ncbi:PAS domain-containing protein [Agrobacterium larrymoorei]|uniref:PAS domain-containing protein n=1 Tax=Agrobacterium larrymoorei TaxID=160699 RepID=A0A4D7DZN4_9HYPH|nr:PAS domain-containing protein [Agrobacterium larrymoorei]QCJ00605.1 hypothetical protein CFBP5473_21635 [Agrobacterium larrymoorei]QYA10603.1 PAS domain-containing protein [Agrobacterium larrymoorei]
MQASSPNLIDDWSISLVSDSVGFFTWDLEQDRNCGDHVMATLFDIDQDELSKGVPIDLILSRISDEDRPRLAKAVHEAITTGAFYAQKYVVSHRNGKKIAVSAFGRCIRDLDGTPTHYAGFVTTVPTVAVNSAREHIKELCRMLQDLAEDHGLELAARHLKAAGNSLG